MEKPLIVEIIAYAPTAFYHCTHCEVVLHEADAGQLVHREQVASSLPQDLALQYQEVSDWAIDISQRFQEKILIKVIDAASMEGIVKSVRYGTRKFPAVIVDHRARFPWSARQAAGAEIAGVLSKAP